MGGREGGGPYLLTKSATPADVTRHPGKPIALNRCESVVHPALPRKSNSTHAISKTDTCSSRSSRRIAAGAGAGAGAGAPAPTAAAPPPPPAVAAAPPIAPPPAAPRNPAAAGPPPPPVRSTKAGLPFPADAITHLHNVRKEATRKDTSVGMSCEDWPPVVLSRRGRAGLSCSTYWQKRQCV